MIEKIQKHEWLQDFAEVGRAHQTCDRAVCPAAGTLDDRSRKCSVSFQLVQLLLSSHHL
jgi:hypothetical protein